MMTHYLKMAVRSLLKFKTQNVIALMGVGLSLLCFSICLYCSRYIFSTNDCFEHKDRIVEIGLTAKGKIMSGTPAELATYLRSQGVEGADFCTVAYPGPRSFNVTISEDKILPYELEVIETDTTYRRVFTPTLIVGNWEQAAQTANAVILTERTALRMFGSANNAIGKPMILSRKVWSSPKTTPREGGIAYTIQAVMKDLPLNTTLNFLNYTDAFVLNDSEGIIRNHFDNVTGCWTYALPHEGKTARQFTDELNHRKLTYELFNETMTLEGNQLGYWLRDNGPITYFGNITLIAGILVLLAGMLNFFHFLTGSFFTRIREYHIRQVNGAGFKELFFLLFTQSTIAILIASLLTFLLIELLAPYLHLTLINFSLFIDAGVLMQQTFTYLLYLLLLCGAVCGCVVFKIRHQHALPGLSGGTGRYSRHSIRNLLLGIQLFIGWIFLSLAAVLYLQSNHTGNSLFNTLTIKEKENILSVQMDYLFWENTQKQDFIAEIRKLPDVEDLLIADINYLQGVSGTGLWLDEGKNEYLEANVLRVSPSFFPFMHIDISAGQQAKTMQEVIIDENVSQRMKQDMLGKTLYDYQGIYTITGVCKPFVADAYNRTRQGYLFLYSDFTDYIGHCYVKCREGKTEEVTSAIKVLLREALPENISPRVQTLMDDIYEEQAVEFKLRGILLFMAMISLLISMLGIYSAITLDTEYRRKEMAIRKINGAGIPQIVLLFARLYLVLLVTSALVAFPLVAVILHYFSLLYASFIDTGFCFYGSIFISVALLTTLTVYARIRNIARVNPAEVIKRE